MKLFNTVLCVIATAMSISAATPSVKFDTPQGRTVTVTAVTDNIIRVTNVAKGTDAPVGTLMVADSGSNAVVRDIDSAVSCLSTPSGIYVTVNTFNGDVVINAGSGKIVVDDGLRYSGNGKKKLTLSTTSRGSYYGAGERGHKLNLRGDTLVMYNRQNYGYTKGDDRINQMNITMPLFLSTDGFAIVFDDYAAAEMILGNDSEISYITESPAPVTYYFVNGPHSLAEVTRSLTALTGRQPLPPLWSLGYITSKYGYHDERETVGVIDSLQQRGYPVDGVVLDLYWYGKEQDMGRLAWDPVQWPDPQKMLADLKKRNVNLVAISQPYVLRNGKGVDNYNYLAQNGMLVADSTGLSPQEVEIWVGEGGMLDVSNPDTKAWLANRYRELTDMGVTGWWGDLGEPEVHPQQAMHKNGLNARLYHNKYGNDWSEIIYDMFRSEYPDRRLLTMMRGGTTGLQKYSVFPWSTDVSRSWEGLQPQVTIMLNSGLSGMGYMGHDVGGFAVDPENPEDAELYVRWLQLGLFSPMLRTHAQYKAEPYHYPQYADVILNLVKERYRWLPYNYTLAYENARYGYPLVRPLNFVESYQNCYDGIDDEYLWGSNVLVAPVMHKGATKREVTFPQGDWYDYNNPQLSYAGGTVATVDAPLNVLPLFVKAGAFVPLADYRMTSTADYNPARFTIKYFASAGHGLGYTLYDDDRVSASALESRNYRLVKFNGYTALDGSSTQIDISAEGTYPGAPSKLDLTFEIPTAKSDAVVTIEGKKVKSKYDVATHTLTFKVKYDPQNHTQIKITYK